MFAMQAQPVVTCITCMSLWCGAKNTEVTQDVLLPLFKMVTLSLECGLSMFSPGPVGVSPLTYPPWVTLLFFERQAEAVDHMIYISISGFRL